MLCTQLTQLCTLNHRKMHPKRNSTMGTTKKKNVKQAIVDLYGRITKDLKE